MGHIHHIIPRHDWKVRFGSLKGFEAPDNRVDLTVAQHAQAHQFLYELNHKTEDLVAWKGLAGIISHEEVVREVCRIAAIKGGKTKPSLETKECMRLAAIERWSRPGQREACGLRNTGPLNPCYGKRQSIESNEKRSKTLMGRKNTWGEKISKAQAGVPRPQTTGEKNGRFSHGRYMKKAV